MAWTLLLYGHDLTRQALAQVLDPLYLGTTRSWAAFLVSPSTCWLYFLSQWASSDDHSRLECHLVPAHRRAKRSTAWISIVTLERRHVVRGSLTALIQEGNAKPLCRGQSDTDGSSSCPTDPQAPSLRRSHSNIVVLEWHFPLLFENLPHC